jgi:Beta-galactosidase.
MNTPAPHLVRIRCLFSWPTVWAACAWLLPLTWAFTARAASAPEFELSPLHKKANEVVFEVGRKAPFLGVFTHVEPAFSLEDKLHSMKQVIERNPFITGITLKIQWKQFHPEPDRIDFEGLEALIDTAARAGKLVTLGLIPGGASPEWIYDFGVKKVGPVRAGARTVTAPVPWDYRYLEIYWGDLRRIQARYGNDPRVWAIKVLGHNYNHVGEEMHAPPAAELKPYGWTKHKFLENWKVWIDLYDEMFPNKKLILVVSQNYTGEPGAEALSEGVARYFVEKCQGRAILMSHQLHGRHDGLAFGPEICRKLSDLAPNAHEFVGSMKETPERQGTMPMVIYNTVQAGNPIFLQLWRRDCDDPTYVKQVLEAWNRYGWILRESLELVLKDENLFVDRANAPKGNFGPGKADEPRERPKDFPSAKK